MKANKNELEEARLKVASYIGMLSRWADATGNIPPCNCKDRDGFIKDEFRKFVDELIDKKKGERGDNRGDRGLCKR